MVIYVSKLPWLRVLLGPVPFESCRNADLDESAVNSQAAVYFTFLPQTPRRASYFQNSTIA